jgi:transcription initiation factor TFIIB
MISETLVEGQIICCNCGLVVSSCQENISIRKEAKNDSPTITPEHIDEISKWQNILRVSDSTERNIALTLYFITKIVRKLQLPEHVLEESIKLYKTILGKCNFKGKRLKAISAAVVYAACKITEIPCSLRKIAKASEEDLQKVFQIYSFMNKNLEIPQIQPSFEKILDYVCRTMRINEQSWNIAKDIISAIGKSENVAGKNLYGYVAAAIYIASMLTGRVRTQREISEITDVTETTIRARCKEVMQSLLFAISI